MDILDFAGLIHMLVLLNCCLILMSHLIKKWKPTSAYTLGWGQYQI